MTPQNRRMPFLGWVFIVLAGLGLLGMLGDCSNQSRNAASDPGPTTGCSASRRAIEARLKSPASAKWGDCNSTTAGGMQTVRLTVDSQNGFGAMIRSQWVTTVRDNAVLSVIQER